MPEENTSDQQTLSFNGFSKFCYLSDCPLVWTDGGKINPYHNCSLAAPVMCVCPHWPQGAVNDALDNLLVQATRGRNLRLIQIVFGLMR